MWENSYYIVFIAVQIIRMDLTPRLPIARFLETVILSDYDKQASSKIKKLKIKEI